MSNPVLGLLRSRKFLVAILDMLVTLVTFFVGKYAGWALEDVTVVIGALQPVVLILIAAIAWEDAAAKRSGNFPFK